MYRVGNDIGGTFTDTIFLDEKTGDLTVGKVLTTGDNPAAGVLRGISELLEVLGSKTGSMGTLIHGTTLVANALIARKGARTALITTRGFRDTLEARREKRYDLYDIFAEMPVPLVSRYWRREVTERLDENGTVLVPLDEKDADKVVRELKAEGIEAIAVCFLHSFRNPAHEMEMKSIIGRVFPQAYVSLSVEVNPEIREYERTSTTVANAYAQPLITRYLAGMSKDLQSMGFEGNMYVMLSNGGITTRDTAEHFPVRVAESGPAAGAIAASFFGELKGYGRVISFDMGGTTAKVCLIEDGKPLVTTDFEVARVHRFKKGSGLPINLPVIDMIEIGAGGGSIAYVDKLGLLKVGPRSAEANPGPCCYDRGGEEPTVTDADLVLGYLSSEYFLGGKMPLNKDRACRAIEEKIAKPLGLDLVRAAWGIHQVVNENMVNAARVHAVEKGKDPKNYTLVAFGGAGPVHAPYLAEKLRMEKVFVPLGAGVTSALGFLVAPFAFDFVKTYMSPLEDIDFEKVNRLFADMEEEGIRLLKKSGLREGDISLQRSGEMRYAGQGHEIVVPLPSGKMSSQDIGTIQEAFDTEYKRLYHRTNPGYKVECLNWRVVASGPKPQVSLRRFPPKVGDSVQKALKGTRLAYFPELGDFCTCPVYDRYSLFQEATIDGPAIVEERECTVIVGPHKTSTFDDHLNMVIE